MIEYIDLVRLIVDQVIYPVTEEFPMRADSLAKAKFFSVTMFATPRYSLEEGMPISFNTGIEIALRTRAERPASASLVVKGHYMDSSAPMMLATHARLIVPGQHTVVKFGPHAPRQIVGALTIQVTEAPS